jgi:hypothetical protein
LLNFAEIRGEFPTAAHSANAGSPQSWRVAILPMLDEQSLFVTYQPTEPWDGSQNLLVSQTPVPIYSCPSDPPATLPWLTTNYFAVIGPHTAWPSDRPRRMNEIKDRHDQTILLIEAAERDMPWAKPSDLTFDKAVELLTTNPAASATHARYTDDGFLYKHTAGDGVHVAFVDGDVKFLPLPISTELAVALLTVSGGETIDPREFDRLTAPQLDYAKCYAIAAFFFVALLPAIRLLRRNELPSSKCE